MMTIFSHPMRSYPFGGLRRLQQELERVFESPAGLESGVSGGGVFPPANVFRSEDGLMICFEVPGIAPENLTIDVTGQVLSVSGKRELPDLANGSAHRHERWSGEFSRSLSLPNNLDPAGITARYEHGVLTLNVPGRKESRPRQIKVEAR